MLCAVKAKAVACEIDAVGIVDEAVENGVGESWVADDLIPTIDGRLARDDDQTRIVTVLDDLEQIAALIGIEGLWPPIVKDNTMLPSSICTGAFSQRST